MKKYIGYGFKLATTLFDSMCCTFVIIILSMTIGLTYGLPDNNNQWGSLEFSALQILNDEIHIIKWNTSK